MSNSVKKDLELRTVSVEKDTWVLQLPDELCATEGFENGTLASLTIRNGAILGTFIHPTQEAKAAAQRFSEKYGDFMQEIADLDR